MRANGNLSGLITHLPMHLSVFLSFPLCRPCFHSPTLF